MFKSCSRCDRPFLDDSLRSNRQTCLDCRSGEDRDTGKATLPMKTSTADLFGFCERCGGPFFREPRSGDRFCSIACARAGIVEANAARALPAKPCEQCGQPMSAAARRGGDARRFCSRECWHDFKRERREALTAYAGHS
jgi:hypothetical protein